MTLAEDIKVFFDTDDFASVATIGTANLRVKGILSREYVESLGVETKMWTFRCAAADVPSIRHDDAVVIDTTTYHVVGREPQDTGSTILLVLEEQ
jgi:hypothetical protein